VTLELEGRVEQLAEPLGDRETDPLAAPLAIRAFVDAARGGRRPAGRLALHRDGIVGRVLERPCQRPPGPGVETGTGVLDGERPSLRVVPQRTVTPPCLVYFRAFSRRFWTIRPNFTRSPSTGREASPSVFR
jgi:hypothetical protein